MLKQETHKLQSSLAQYTRDGHSVDIEGAKSDRLPHYRRLVFNVIFDSLSSAYPIARKIVDREWKGLVDRYFGSHACQNHQVWRMPEEFKNYVIANEQDLVERFQFLPDLLLFEWMEIEIYSEADKVIPTFQSEGDWKTQAWVLNPHARLLRLNYPVFRKEYESMNDQQGEYHLLIVRNLETFKVQFIQVPALYAAVLDAMDELGGHFANGLQISTQQIETIAFEDILQQTESSVNTWLEKGYILGFQ